MQQSAVLDHLLPADEKSFRQLLLPHLSVPSQSESLSQSPPPMVHGLVEVQQLQSVLGTPLHDPPKAMKNDFEMAITYLHIEMS